MLPALVSRSSYAYVCSTLTCMVHLYAVAAYEWGNDVTRRPDSVQYSDVILLPDPELLAPSDGVLNHLDFYSVHANKSFRLVVLRSVGRTADNGSAYAVRNVTGCIHAEDPGVHRIDLSSDGFHIGKDDVVSFLIYDQMPIPYEKSLPCSGSRRFLLANSSSSVLVPDRILDFELNGRDECWTLSYTIGVSRPDISATNGGAGSENNEVTQRQMNDAKEVSINGDDRMATADICQASCDIRTDRQEKEDDIYRYVIFGPLIVLWVIVSIICSAKLKRRLPCCRKSGVGAVTPTSLTGGETSRRRGRCRRVTLTRLPPPGVVIMSSEPKPGVVPPPYPGLDDGRPDYRFPSGYPPSYPPPAYTPSDNKAEQVSSLRRCRGLPTVEEVAARDDYANADEAVQPGCETSDVAGLGRTPGERNHFDGTVPGQPRCVDLAQTAPADVMWNRCYAMYPPPPPPYEESSETHM